MNNLLVIFRTLVFYLGYAVFTIFWGTLSLLVAWALPFEWRFRFIIQVWTRVVLWWLRVTCGVRFVIEGRENIPQQPCLVLCKHESTWETLALQQVFSPQSTLVKRELLRIPFFGWAFSLLKPIAINRSDRRKALRQLVEKGSRRLEDGIWVMLFPEGTRTEPGTLLPFQAGAGLLAKATGAPVLVVSHDAGRCWPARSFLKHAGVIRVRIAVPFSPAGLDTKSILRQAEVTMGELTDSLYAHPAPPSSA